MKILLIEDEAHKREEISTHLRAFYGDDLSLTIADSVRAAISDITQNDYGLIVLDMALPTFSLEEKVSDTGLDQALGGVEVLRTLRALNKIQHVIIVTQYPDIFLDGRRVKIAKAQYSLEKKYGQTIVGSVLYKYKSPNTRNKVHNLLRHLK